MLGLRYHVMPQAQALAILPGTHTAFWSPLWFSPSAGYSGL